MIVHLINPFQYGNKRQWDLVIEDNEVQLQRQTVTFNILDSDEIITDFITSYISDLFTISEIIIDKPTEWQS